MKLTTKQLCEKYSKHPITIYRWVDKGMPCTKVMDGLREVYQFDSEDVDKWLKGEK